jgi:hypothetical protein
MAAAKGKYRTGGVVAAERSVERKTSGSRERRTIPGIP